MPNEKEQEQKSGVQIHGVNGYYGTHPDYKSLVDARADLIYLGMDLKNKFSYYDFFEEKDFEKLQQFTADGGKKTLGFDEERNDQYIYPLSAYALAMTDTDLDGIMNMDQAEKRKIGAGFVQFVLDHPVDDTEDRILSEEERNRNLAAWGQLYRKGDDQFLKDHLPEFDPTFVKEPSDKSLERMSFLKQRSIGKASNTDHMIRHGAFLEGYGGAESFVKIDTEQTNACYLAVAARDAYVQPASKPYQELSMLNILPLAVEADKIKGYIGRPIGEIGAEIPDFHYNNGQYVARDDTEDILRNGIAQLDIRRPENSDIVKITLQKEMDLSGEYKANFLERVAAEEKISQKSAAVTNAEIFKRYEDYQAQTSLEKREELQKESASAFQQVKRQYLLRALDISEKDAEKFQDLSELEQANKQNQFLTETKNGFKVELSRTNEVKDLSKLKKHIQEKDGAKLTKEEKAYIKQSFEANFGKLREGAIGENLKGAAMDVFDAIRVNNQSLRAYCQQKAGKAVSDERMMQECVALVGSKTTVKNEAGEKVPCYLNLAIPAKDIKTGEYRLEIAPIERGGDLLSPKLNLGQKLLRSLGKKYDNAKTWEKENQKNRSQREKVENYLKVDPATKQERNLVSADKIKERKERLIRIAEYRQFKKAADRAIQASTESCREYRRQNDPFYQYEERLARITNNDVDVRLTVQSWNSYLEKSGEFALANSRMVKYGLGMKENPTADLAKNGRMAVALNQSIGQMEEAGMDPKAISSKILENPYFNTSMEARNYSAKEKEVAAEVEKTASLKGQQMKLRVEGKSAEAEKIVIGKKLLGAEGLRIEKELNSGFGVRPDFNGRKPERKAPERKQPEANKQLEKQGRNK